MRRENVAMHKERKCADTTGTVLVLWVGHFDIASLPSVYLYIFQIKYTEAILSNSTRKLLWFKINKMLMHFKENLLSFIIIFGTLSFTVRSDNPHHFSLPSVTILIYTVSQKKARH